MFGNKILILFFTSLIFFGCNKSKPNITEKETLHLLQDITRRYIKSECSTLKSPLVIVSEVENTSDVNYLKVVTYVGDLPVKGQELPSSFEKLIFEKREIICLYFLPNQSFDRKKMELKLKEEGLITWIDERSKWNTPIKNAHFPNSYTAWYSFVCRNNYSLVELIKSPHELIENEYPVLNCTAGTPPAEQG